MGGGSQKQKTNQTSTNKPPQWWEDAAIKSLQVADRINQAGYVPYMGNEIAAFTPMQERAMQSASDWMSAANGEGKVNAMAGMPAATVDGSGVKGYSSAPGMMRNLELLKERFPAQYDLLTQFGGDLLANPSKPANAVANSPWNVGATAAASSSAARAAPASGSGGGIMPFGYKNKGNNSMFNILYSMGYPSYGTNGGSVYEDEYMKALRAGKDPNTVMPWYQAPAAAPAAPAAAPATNYVNPSKWW